MRLISIVGLALASALTAGEPTIVARLGSERFRQKERVEAITYSHDGKQIATADSDTIHIWDAADGTRFRKVPLEKHTILELRYTPDGKRILALTQLPIEVKGVTNPAPILNRIIIDADSGMVTAETRLTVRKGTGTFSANAAWLALIEESQESVRLIDAATGKEVWTHKLMPQEGAESIAWHPNGKTVAVGTLGGRVLICDCKTGEIFHDYVMEGNNSIQRMVFAPDGKDIVAEVSRPDPNHVIRFEASTGTVRWKLQAIRASELAFTADGKDLMFWGCINVSGDPYSWRLLNAETGKLKPGRMYTGYGNAVAVRPDGKVVALGGYLGHISQWDLSTRKRLGDSSADPPGPVSSLQFSADGTMVRGWSSGWYEWDLKSGRQTRLSPKLDIGPDDRVVTSRDGKLMAIARVAEEQDEDEGRILELIELGSGKRKSIGRVRDQEQFHLLADGRLAVIRDGIAVYDPKTGKQAVKITKDRDDQVITISDNGKSAVAVTAAAETLRAVRWDLGRNRKLDDLACRLADPGLMRGSGCWRTELFADGRILAIYFSHVAHPGTPVGLNPIIEEHTALFDANTGRYLSGWWDEHFTARFAFGADGRSVACYYPAGLGIDLREIATGERRTRISISSSISGCCFSADGNVLAVATSPNPIEIWQPAGKPGVWEQRKADEYWDTFRSDDSDSSFGAMVVLRAHPEKGIALLKQKVVVSTAPAAEAIAGPIKDLDSPDFRRRELASKDIAAFGEVVLPRLRNALAEASPEARERLLNLIAKAEAMTPDKLRAIRACEVLEGISSAEAKALLTEWARGAPAATLTREAAESLERLKRQGD
jgi:WD40 repeat protein